MFRKTNIAIIISAAAFFVSATAASAAEIQLAGIKLGRSALSIIQKYGDPSEIRVGGRGQAVDQSGGMDMGLEMPPAGMAMGSTEGPPPGMGLEMPPTLGGPNAGGPQQGQSAGKEINWVYRFAKNKTLEFIIDAEGRVIQIAAFGIEWPGMKTSKGIGLGSTYKQVIMTYGFPETHDRSGIEMVTKYANSHRVAFSLVGNQVVGITIAFMD